MSPDDESVTPPASIRRSIRLPLALVAGILILLAASLAANLAQVLGRIDVPPDVPLVAGAPRGPEGSAGGSVTVPAVLPPVDQYYGHQQEPIFW
jgi:hypothetical protein